MEHISTQQLSLCACTQTVLQRVSYAGTAYVDLHSLGCMHTHLKNVATQRS